MNFHFSKFKEKELILDIYIPGYRFVQLKDEDVLRVYGVAVFVDMEMMRRTMDTCAEICNGKKRKIFVDPSLEVGMTNEARRLLRTELPKMTSAVALINTNIFTRVSSNLLLKISSDEFKVRVFSDHDKALDWVRKQ